MQKDKEEMKYIREGRIELVLNCEPITFSKEFAEFLTKIDGIKNFWELLENKPEEIPENVLTEYNTLKEDLSQDYKQFISDIQKRMKERMEQEIRTIFENSFEIIENYDFLSILPLLELMPPSIFADMLVSILEDETQE